MNLIKKENVIYIVGLLFCGSFYPAFWTSILVGQMTMLLHVFFLLVWTITIAIYCKGHFKSLNHLFNKLYLVVCFCYLLRFIFTFDTDNLVSLLRLAIFYCDIYVTNTLLVVKPNMMTKFIYFHIIMLFLTIIGLILFTMGLLSPLGIIEISSLGEECLLNFGFYFVKLHDGATDLVDSFARPAGYYDEPGSLGLMILLLLLYNKVNLKNRIIEILLLVGGFVSMSMAYIAAAFLYIALFLINKKYISVFLFFIPIVMFTISSYKEGKNDFADFVYDKTVGRSEKIRSGDDQSRNYAASFEAFKDNWLFGESVSVLDRKYPQSTHETIWYFFAQNGIFGSIILFSPLWFIVYRHKNLVYKKSILILLIIILQRPDYFQPLYLIMLYSTFYSKKESKYRFSTSLK